MAEKGHPTTTFAAIANKTTRRCCCIQAPNMSSVMYIEKVLGSKAVEEINIPVDRTKKIKVSRETLGPKVRVHPLQIAKKSTQL